MRGWNVQTDLHRDKLCNRATQVLQEVDRGGESRVWTIRSLNVLEKWRPHILWMAQPNFVYARNGWNPGTKHWGLRWWNLTITYRECELLSVREMHKDQGNAVQDQRWTGIESLTNGSTFPQAYHDECRLWSDHSELMMLPSFKSRHPSGYLIVPLYGSEHGSVAI